VEEKRVARREPLAFFEAMQDEMERLWGRMPFGFRPLLRRNGEVPELWAPRMDIFEKDGALMVKAELPGVKKEDVAVTLDDGDLVIRGERKAESEVKEENYYRMERTYGEFYRRMPLPFEAKADGIKASFTDGVLEIIVPKPAAEKPAAETIPVG
jgi:HSP20 family protein